MFKRQNPIIYPKGIEPTSFKKIFAFGLLNIRNAKIKGMIKIDI